MVLKTIKRISRRVAHPKYAPLAKYYVRKYAPYVLGAYAGYRLLRRRRLLISRKRKLSQRAINIGTGGSISKFYYGKRRLSRTMYRVYKDTSKLYYAYDGSIALDARSSQQKFYTPVTMFDVADITSMMSCNGISYLTNPTLRLNYESCSSELTFTNMTDANIRVTLFDIVARRDSSDKPETNLTGAVTAEQDPGSEGSYSYPFSPFTVDSFTQFFKVLKMTHIVLATGQTHVHRIHYAPNKVINGTSVLNGPAGIDNLKGLTCFTMIQLVGVPAISATDDTLSSTSIPKLSVCWKTSYRYGFISNNVTRLDLNTNLEEINPDIMEIDGDPNPEVIV